MRQMIEFELINKFNAVFSVNVCKSQEQTGPVRGLCVAFSVSSE